MKCKLIKLGKLSGKAASIYSLKVNDEEKTRFDMFLEENESLFKSELKDILLRITAIGQCTGAREQYFKRYEGVPGDLVCALYDNPDKNLRLYCIRYGTSLVILGGGGQKNVQKLQEDSKLEQENLLMRDLSAKIKERMDSREIGFTSDYMEFEGNLTFNDEDDE